MTTNTTHDWSYPATQMTARAALAKAGVQLTDREDRASLLADRNAIRRTISDVQARAEGVLAKASAGDAAAQKIFDTCTDELEALAAVASRKQRLLDVAEGVNSNGTRSQLKALRTADDFQAHYRERSAGGEAFDIADFLRGVANMGTTTAVRNALSVGTDSSGGFTVPTTLMPGILQALAPASSLMQAGAGIVPLEEGAKSYTYAGIDALPTAAWRLEAGNVPESDPTFRAVVGAPKSLSFRFKLSRELLADGRNLTEALNVAIGQAFAAAMDRAGLLGTGTNPEPRGLLNTAGVQAVANGTNGASLATTRFANFFTATQAIMQANGPMPSAAIMAPRSRVVLAGQLDTTGQPLMVPPMLQPMQMIVTSQIPVNLTVGTSTDCSLMFLGSFENLVFLLREAPSVQVLNELHAATGEIGFAAHARVDVAVLRPSVFALVTGVRP
jgi:HK97 family phage major capsid protein